MDFDRLEPGMTFDPPERVGGGHCTVLTRTDPGAVVHRSVRRHRPRLRRSAVTFLLEVMSAQPKTWVNMERQGRTFGRIFASFKHLLFVNA